MAIIVPIWEQVVNTAKGHGFCNQKDLTLKTSSVTSHLCETGISLCASLGKICKTSIAITFIFLGLGEFK